MSTRNSTSAMYFSTFAAISLIVGLPFPIVSGERFDNDEALSKLLQTDFKCSDIAISDCERFNFGITFLCQFRCQSLAANLGLENSCTDQNFAIEAVWNAGISDLGIQEGMTCNRTRAALHCTKEPFASLCPDTCQLCVGGLRSEQRTSPVEHGVEMQYIFQKEVINHEVRQAKYECAVKRRDSGFDCDKRDEICPEF